MYQALNTDDYDNCGHADLVWSGVFSRNRRCENGISLVRNENSLRCLASPVLSPECAISLHDIGWKVHILNASKFNSD
jgi:hypothetical protein